MSIINDIIAEASIIIDEVHEEVIAEMEDIEFHRTMNALMQKHIAQEYIAARTLLTQINHGALGVCECRVCTK